MTPLASHRTGFHFSGATEVSKASTPPRSAGGTPVRIVDVAQATGDSFCGTWDIVFANGKLFWTGVFGPAVYSANLDGTSVTPVIANSASIGANRSFGITEYQGTIYFGDSEQASTAIYSVGITGQNARLLVNGSSDDRYPLVLPPDNSNPGTQSPTITSFGYAAASGLVQISITGAPSIGYNVRESITPNFSSAGGASIVLVGGQGSAPYVLTTDAAGMASGSFSLDPSKQINFLRVEQAPWPDQRNRPAAVTARSERREETRAKRKM